MPMLCNITNLLKNIQRNDLVKDAISSILVAKSGHGDMAVSNAVGSNVFDINLGLGLPFLVNSIATGKPVHLLNPLQQVNHIN